MTHRFDLLAGLLGSFAPPAILSPIRADNPREHGDLHTIPSLHAAASAAVKIRVTAAFYAAKDATAQGSMKPQSALLWRVTHRKHHWNRISTQLVE